ncbi:MAG TPA: dihydroorotate dehydrogenase electron transfer subunit [Candidatus Polarisedimenticolia bacterium]|nr:dihydroorotate dehydrogenase electron transfer subunit [Candidatus Polarisedimenticolia bacterium]
MSASAGPVDRHLRIENHEHLGAAHYLLTLATEDAIPSWDPGQFAMISVGQAGPSSDPLLRRPFSIYNRPGAHRGAGDGQLQIFYKVLGRGTGILSTAPPGGTIRCLAPLGNGFAPTRPDGARLLLVAGGIGAASLHPLGLAEKAQGREPLMLYGCRNAADLAGVTQTVAAGIDTLIATDDGSAGRRGLAGDLLDSFLSDEGPSARERWVICSCGPTPMMKAVAVVAARHEVRCYVSLESPMACGFGVCVGCVVATRELPDGPAHFRRICVEGPVFDAARVCW